MRIASLLIIAGLLEAAPAHADPRPLSGEHWELGVGLAIMPDPDFATIDAPSAMGLLASVGRQLGHWRLAGELEFVSFSEPFSGRGGQMQRVGAVARYRLGLPVAAGNLPYDTGFYVEGGAGRQMIAWARGGDASRKDLSMGLGYEMAGGTHRIGGFDFGVEVLAAQPIGTDPMKDHTLDLAWMIHLGGILGY